MLVPTNTTIRKSLAATRIHRAVWRWHFYAGLLSLPFLILLAATGAIYLFEKEIDHALYRDMMIVSPLGIAADPQTIVAAAQAAKPGWSVARFETPESPNLAVEIALKKGDENVSVFVDPYSAEVTGMRAGEGPMPFVSRLHSLAVAGPYANRVIEAVAGWTIILFATGIYLWLPSGKKQRQPANAKPLSRRRIWRTLHVYTGLGAGAVIVFLALTGLPWSSVWGGGLNDMARQHGLGMPKEIWSERPQSASPDPALPGPASPWIMQDAPRPASHPSAANAIGFGRAVTLADKAGMPDGFWIEAPWGPKGVYTVMAMPDDATAQRVLHVDQYSGETIMDIRYADYGAIAQTVELGVGIHMGQQLGWANKTVMLAGCIALIVLAVSSLALTWRRRNKNPLSAPIVERRSMAVISGITCAGLIVFPMTAVSAIAIAVGDLAYARVRRQSTHA